MMKYILVVDEERRAQDYIFEGARRRGYMFDMASLDFEMRSQINNARDCSLWKVDEVDIDAAVEQISKWHPGKELIILNAEKSYQRTFGPLTEKKHTKEGVLPI